MTRDVYYEEELRYLKEEGARFAQKHPRRAKYLNFGSVKDRDPNVDTLFEGFAFLCAGIRERIDGALPRLAADLTGLLWPRLLHPVPSTCVVEFKPRAGMLQRTHIVRKEAAVFTTDPDPVSKVCCRFAAARDVRVNPIAINNAGVVTGGGRDALTLSFKIEQGVRPESLSLSPVRIFINDDLPAALSIRQTLLRHVEAVILRDDRGREKKLIPQDTFVEGGFGEDEELFPEAQNTNRQLSLLRDYFTFPERFLFVDIFGLDSLPPSGAPASVLSLEIRFDRKLPGGICLTKETFKLHCVPAVNVFRRDAEPVIADGKRCEYDLTADALHPESFEIHSVEAVTGVDRVSGERREYEGYCGLGDGRQRFYSVRADRQPGGNRLSGGGRRITLSMNGYQTENNRLLNETLHIETWQTNGTLARKILADGGALRKAAPEFPDYITFANITVPCHPVNPPFDDNYLWAFLSHLSAAYSNFSDAKRLREFLRVYDWLTMPGDKRQEIEAILSVSVKPCDLIVDRAVIRGTEMNVRVDESAAPEENFFLLGGVIARSLSCMASINTFLKLVLTMTPSGKTFVWNNRSGERI
ncbi:MAG: type VI secretion system baseplate subunit TssF [Chitinispirillales bacterium]|jgi:type VI secretion system protein ImpG|nr:type VI secretion system baseplate subunit TssF [Chitinispirillales bacterium]